ncbi:MAG TPA: phosphoglucosamine mutase [Pyrinomonadaceae bacterium]|nr:phosphoglucosamine mutase [Pyrinomonadaceae bacterium]
MKRLFGTDGIRGVADEFPLDRGTVETIGTSLARHFREKLGRGPIFLSGRDTRESGERLERAFHAGVISAGGRIESAEVITTPGVAFLTRKFDFDAGIVISASHNPFGDNGIKIFSPSGEKVGEDIERQIEADVSGPVAPTATDESIGMDTSRVDVFRSAYLEHLAIGFNESALKGRSIAVDCANGAASAFAPDLFRALGADVVAINDDPDGKNINFECGSLHLERIRETTLSNNAEIGVAFDGDSDRALFIDEAGNIVDGDAVLWVLASYLQDRGRIKNKTVVATVMSNIGLEIALASRGIKLVRAAVGDKFVLDELLRTGSELGGEQSGHIILTEQSLVGDGIMTALLLIKALSENGRALSELTAGFVRYPQVLVNVKVREKKPFDSSTHISAVSTEIERELDGKGRLLLRYSGTENLARVMIEGEDQTSIESQAKRLADVISSQLG